MRKKSKEKWIQHTMQVLAIVIVIALCYFFILNGGYFTNEQMRFTANLKAGWSLGNTFDVHNLHFQTTNPQDYETYWNNPVTTQKIIQDIKDANFTTIRIPVTWYEHVDENYIIDEVWMARIQQVVDLCINSGFYVILNSHHDSVYSPRSENMPIAENFICILWTQIAECFASYDNHLLFESMNEPRDINSEYEWNVGTSEMRENINKLNAVFVDAIRGSSGFNSERYLVLPTYCARPETIALEDFRMPKGKNLILSVHMYKPYSFSQNEYGTTDWTSSNSNDTNEINQMMNDLERLFISKNIPVIIGELGAIDKNNEDTRAQWIAYIAGKAAKLGIPCIWWDAGGNDRYSIYDRYNAEWRFPKIRDALVNSFS
ncbi:glycoside hydrolase family 5 protein [Lachnospiraceae bacterium ZAX-1]